MGKPFEVKEFDTVICNPNYKNDANYKYLDEKQFNKLEKFIREFTVDENNTDALDFMRIGLKRNVGNTITIKNYVGLIEMDDRFQIQVLPKISFGNQEDSSNENTKRVFLKMLKAMKDMPWKEFNDAGLKVDKMNLYEVFINMYIQEVRHLIKKGLKSSYVIQEENLNYYKGKLLVGKHLKNNLVHKERFYVSYDEYIQNISENKLIKSTLLKLQKLTSSPRNSKEIKQLLVSFEIVDESTNIDYDLSKVVINRNNINYDSLIKWSKVFLKNKSFTTFSGNTKSRSLLFPMEKIFESYVAKNMKKVFSLDGWYVSSQDKGHYLFNTPKNQFALRPDIVLTKDNRTIIMDTKWKNLNNNSRSNYGISQADMYQMYAYAKKYETSEIWLLYPVNDNMRNHETISFISNDNVEVNVFFVDVADIEVSLNELKKIL